MKLDKKYIRVLHWLLIVVAYTYLVYKLVTFGNYPALLNSFHNANILQYVGLLLAMLLFPVNLGLESWRWQYLMRDVEPMSFYEANKQVYYGMVGGFLTPYRVGDFPARVLLMRDKSKWLMAICMALIGSYAITIVIIVLGLPSLFLIFSGTQLRKMWFVFVVAVISIFLFMIAPLFFRKLQQKSWRGEKAKTLVEILARMRYGEYWYIIFQAFLRYICFCVQFALVLWFCGVDLTFIQMLLAIPLYYLLITVTPNVPAAEIGIRGSWAIVVFSYFSEQTAALAVIAAVLLWIINTIPPVIIGTLLKKKEE